MTPEQKALFDKLTELQQGTAINRLAGMSQVQAYYAAGGTAENDNAAGAIASRMLSDANVKAFTDAMKVQAVSDAVMSRQEAIEKLSLLARVNLSDITRFETSEIGKDLESGESIYQTAWHIPADILDKHPDKLAIISSLEIGKNGPKIGTHSQPQAIAQLSKMLGWDAPQKSEITVTRQAGDLTDDELAAIAAAEDDKQG